MSKEQTKESVNKLRNEYLDISGYSDEVLKWHLDKQIKLLEEIEVSWLEIYDLNYLETKGFKWNVMDLKRKIEQQLKEIDEI